MDPAIPVHSVVLVQPAAPEKLQPGEIVAYRSGSSVVIHRLVENHIVEGKLVTKGDANAEPDPLKVEYVGVLGTVTAHIPFIGIYAGALNTLPGKLYAFGFIVAAAMLYPRAETGVRLLRKNAICTKAGCTRLAKRVQ